ncbi:thermonuclease family protein, partial [Akkermansia sp.]
MKWLPFFFLGSCIAFGEEIRGVVINVIDGDTIVVLEKTPEEKIVHKVRLEGIDAPERGQDGYDGAKHYLEKLIWGETVTVRYIGRDRYGRILGLVVYGTASVDEEMVREGWAWRYKHSTSRKLASHESEARAGKK